MKKVCCIKNFIGEKEYEKFISNNIYNVKSYSDNVIVICFEENSHWSNAIAFKHKSNKDILQSLPVFEDFFMELKEYRKVKLKKINKIFK